MASIAGGIKTGPQGEFLHDTCDIGGGKPPLKMPVPIG
jgi:hypothetical protein